LDSLNYLVLLGIIENSPDAQEGHIIELRSNGAIHFSDLAASVEDGVRTLLQELVGCLLQPLVPIGFDRQLLSIEVLHQRINIDLEPPFIYIASQGQLVVIGSHVEAVASTQVSFLRVEITSFLD